MSSDRAILLISDRPDRSQVLARRFGGLCTCRTKGLYEQESTAELVTAVVTDVRFRHPSDIERLHHLLSKPRALAAPIVAILRDNSYLQRVQAGEVGATFLFPANVSVSSALAPVFRSTILLGRADHELGASAKHRAGPTPFWNHLQCSRARRRCEQDECRQRDRVRHGCDSRRRHPTMARSCLDLRRGDLPA